jgi:hypothetical protein
MFNAAGASVMEMRLMPGTGGRLGCAFYHGFMTYVEECL